MTNSSLNDRTGRRGRAIWSVLLLVTATLVTGFLAYDMGLSQGAARAQAALSVQAPPAAQAAPVPPPYFYYYGQRPWGYGGFGFFHPFVFLVFWFVVLRVFLWGGPWRRHRGYGGMGPGWRADEWHRQAHERMGSPPAADGRPAGAASGDDARA